MDICLLPGCCCVHLKLGLQAFRGCCCWAVGVLLTQDPGDAGASANGLGPAVRVCHHPPSGPPGEAQVRHQWTHCANPLDPGCTGAGCVLTPDCTGCLKQCQPALACVLECTGMAQASFLGLAPCHCPSRRLPVAAPSTCSHHHLVLQQVPSCHEASWPQLVSHAPAVTTTCAAYAVRQAVTPWHASCVAQPRPVPCTPQPCASA